MYSKAQASALTKEFWTALGLYLKPVQNAEGAYINWVNYKTGIRHIYFRMDAGKNAATIAIEIKHPKAAQRLALFEKLLDTKSFFEQVLQETWQWQPDVFDEDGVLISKIFTSLDAVTIFNKKDWPAIITFLKHRIILLDAFWQMAKPQLEALNATLQ